MSVKESDIHLQLLINELQSNRLETIDFMISDHYNSSHIEDFEPLSVFDDPLPTLQATRIMTIFRKFFTLKSKSNR